MSSSSHRRLRWPALLFWAALTVAVWYGGQALLHPLTVICYSAAEHCLLHAPAEQEPQLVRADQPVLMHEVTEQKTVWEVPTVGMVNLNEEACETCFAALPLGPQDLAVILNRLREGGAEVVGISSALTWQQEPGDMAREMLCRVINSFGRSAVGLRGRTAAQADFTPLVLRDTAIPTAQVSGDPTGLPAANKALPNGLTEVPDAVHLNWAPDWLQDEPLTHKPSAVENRSFPLLVRWNGETIPTLPLRLALASRGLSSADVKVRLGQDISFGGLCLPLDEHGRVTISRGKTLLLPLAEIVAGTDLKARLGSKPFVMLEQPAAGQDTPQRLERLAATLSELAAVPHVEQQKSMQPVGSPVLHECCLLTGWKQVTAALIVLLLALRCLPSFPALLRRSLMLAALFAPFLRAWYLLPQGLWLPLVPLALTWLVLALALRALKPAEKSLFRR